MNTEEEVVEEMVEGGMKRQREEGEENAKVKVKRIKLKVAKW